jgi:hypothetical protein
MADFKHLASLRVQDNATVEYTFYRIGGDPTLSVQHAGRSNVAFFNAALRQTKIARRKAKSRKGAGITAASIEQARQEDIQMFAEFIVTGWSGVLDSKGKEVPYSQEVCIQFLNAIPPDMFDELREFCLDIENFRELDDTMDPQELEELKGN